MKEKLRYSSFCFQILYVLLCGSFTQGHFLRMFEDRRVKILLHTYCMLSGNNGSCLDIRGQWGWQIFLLLSVLNDWFEGLLICQVEREKEIGLETDLHPFLHYTLTIFKS